MEPFALNLKGMTLVIVKPGEGVSTREAYAGVRPRIPEVPLAERLGRPVAEWQGLVTNDFEEHIFAGHPCRQRAPAGRRGRLRLDVGQRLGGFRTLRGA